jgi:hypothetical protein
VYLEQKVDFTFADLKNGGDPRRRVPPEVQPEHLVAAAQVHRLAGRWGCCQGRPQTNNLVFELSDLRGQTLLLRVPIIETAVLRIDQLSQTPLCCDEQAELQECYQRECCYGKE